MVSPCSLAELVGVLGTAVSNHTRDLEGGVLLPGLIDAHTHLDKTFSTLENESGTLGEALQVWRRVRESRTGYEIQTAAHKAVKLAIVNRVTAMRSHVDVGGAGSLTAVSALLDLREQVRHQIDLQFVALGQAGQPNHRTKLIEVLKMGVDLVGGAPALCADPQAEIDAVFEIATQLDKPIDETEDPQMRTLEYLAEQTIAHGMEGQVTGRALLLTRVC